MTPVTILRNRAHRQIPFCPLLSIYGPGGRSPDVSSVPIASQEILLATDFCEPARRALALAKTIARRRSSSLHAVHVLDLTRAGELAPRSFAAAHDSAQRALREIRRELRTAGLESAATLVSAGKPAAALREWVGQRLPSLLILGLNGATSQDPAAVGATARSLLAAPPCPILTVSERCPELSARALERLVIVIDAAPESLRAALDTWPLEPRQPAPAILAVLPRRTKTDWNLPAARGRRFRPIVLLDQASAADAVLRHATEKRSGLILMSYASGTPSTSLSRGSMAHTLLTQAPCPVLTVRA